MHARRIAVMATTLAVVAGATVAMLPRPASAAVGYRPVPNDSWGTNGTSEEVLIQGGTVYVGGAFSAALHGGSSATRNNVAAFDEASGALVQTFVADTNGTVETLATFGGALFLGGTFTTVNGVARKNLAKVDLSTGAVDPAFDPSPNNTVYDLWVSGTTLYLGGDFTTMAGQSRPRVAAINLMTTGSLVAGFAPKVDRRVSAVATSPDGATVYVGGRFSTVNSQPADYLAAIKATDGSLLNVDFVGVEPIDPTTQTSNVLDLDASATQVFVAIGGQHFNVVGAWNASSGMRTWWHGADANDHLDGDVQGLELEGSTLYFVFHGGYNGNTSLRMMAAAAGDGTLDPDFRPATNGVAGMTDVATDGSYLAAVGDFKTSGGVALKGVGLFPAVGGGGGTTTSSSTTSSTTSSSTTSSSTTSSTSSTTSSTTTSTSSTTTSTTTSTTLPTGGTKTVSPSVQTPDRKPSGTIDADDAAVWNKGNPATAVILGTIKEGGLDVYKADGTVVQSIAGNGGRFNNVDLVYDVVLGGQPARDLAVVTDRATDKLHIYAVDGASATPVQDVTAANVPLLFGGTKPVKSKTAYGVAAWRNPAGVAEVFATQENTTNLGKWVLIDAGGGKVSYQPAGTYSFPNTFTLPNSTTWTPCFNPAHPDWQAHAEGMVVDPATGTLWADQELVGLWKLTTNLTSPQLVHKLKRFGQTYTVSNGKCVINNSSTSFGDSYLPGDLEGIGLFQNGSNGYLVMSNQNSSVFTVFDRDGGTYRGSFKVGAAGSIDAVDKTDGVAITNMNMGGAFGGGMLITQDGKDTPEGGTNFKFTPWSAVASAMGI